MRRSVRTPGHRVLGLALLALASIAACGRKTIEVKPSDEIYAAATRDFEDENWGIAIERYRHFLDHYPLDPRGQEVEYRIARAHFKDDKYAEAIQALSDFQRMYPTSPRIPEVEYTICKAYLAQMDSVDRDLSAARNAHDHLQSIIRRYPNTEYAERASVHLKHVREHLAQRELYIAEFYFKRNQYGAAKTRVSEILLRFPETESATTALELLAQAARENDDSETAKLAETAQAELSSEQPSDDVTAAPTPPPSPALATLRARLRGPSTSTPAPAAQGAS